MLIVFPQSQDCGVTVGHDLTAANENGFIGAGFLCSYWYMCWYSDFFFAGAIQYPGLKDFSVYGENETSLLNEVTETSFPIYKTDVEEILNNI